VLVSSTMQVEGQAMNAGSRLFGGVIAEVRGAGCNADHHVVQESNRKFVSRFCDQENISIASCVWPQPAPWISTKSYTATGGLCGVRQTYSCAQSVPAGNLSHPVRGLHRAGEPDPTPVGPRDRTTIASDQRDRAGRRAAIAGYRSPARAHVGVPEDVRLNTQTDHNLLQRRRQIAAVPARTEPHRHTA
jgi:hypothetical protein